MHPVRFARRRPKLAVLLIGVLALVFAGVGYALWTMTQQTSNFQGKTAGTIVLTISAPTAGDLSAAQQCVPGGSCPILAEVSNPSSAPIQITSYQASNTNSFDNGPSATCDSSNFTGPAETTTLTGITPVTVAANAVNQVVTLPNALTLKPTAPTACQAQTIFQNPSNHLTLTYTAGS